MSRKYKDSIVDDFQPVQFLLEANWTELTRSADGQWILCLIDRGYGKFVYQVGSEPAFNAIEQAYSKGHVLSCRYYRLTESAFDPSSNFADG